MVTECIYYIAVEKYKDSGRHVVGFVYEGTSFFLSSFGIEKG